MPSASHSTVSALVAEKRALRARCTTVREALSPELRQEAALALADNARALRLGGRGSSTVSPTVSGYAAMGAELDVLPLLARLAGDGCTTCLPVVTPLGSPLVFRAWAPGEALVARKWGIREPAETAPAVEPDILLVPLLAFDKGGWRLGYGGGYYDRTIARLRALKPVIAVGIAYDEQEIDRVPREPHDQQLDWVLTPGGMRRPTATAT